MKVLTKISSLFLALAVLVATMSFTIGKHYCQGKLKNIALFEQAEKCAHEKNQQKPSCHKVKMTCHQKKETKPEKSCCDSETKVVESAQEDYKVPTILEFQPNLSFVAVELSTFSISNYSARYKIVKYLNYIPPLIDEDLPVLVQSFLL